jgi:hypothetical protein
LVVDVKLPPRVHVYAPGVEGYRPIAVTVEPSPWVKSAAPRFPASKMLELRAIHETVPVYERQARIVVDALIANTGALLRTLAKAPDATQTITVAARLQYQACDDKVCYQPAEIPLAWTLKVKLPDQQRVGEEKK